MESGTAVAFWLYLAACLLLPTLWGAFMAWLIQAWEKRRGTHRFPADDGTSRSVGGGDSAWGYEI